MSGRSRSLRVVRGARARFATGESDGGWEMPRRRRPATDRKIFVASLDELSDAQVVAMAAAARRANRPGRYARWIREALDAEVGRRHVADWVERMTDAPIVAPVEAEL